MGGFYKFKPLILNEIENIITKLLIESIWVNMAGNDLFNILEISIQIVARVVYPYNRLHSLNGLNRLNRLNRLLPTTRDLCYNEKLSKS